MKLTNMINNILESDQIKAYRKKVQSKDFAKKVKSKWSYVLTNAGDKNGLSKERSPQDVIDKKPRVISPNGIKNLWKLYINVGMDDVGANIASQAWNGMSDKDILKMVNNVAKEIGIKGWDGIEKLPLSDGMKLKESKYSNDAIGL